MLLDCPFATSTELQSSETESYEKILECFTNEEYLTVVVPDEEKFLDRDRIAILPPDLVTVIDNEKCRPDALLRLDGEWARRHRYRIAGLCRRMRRVASLTRWNDAKLVGLGENGAWTPDAKSRRGMICCRCTVRAAGS